MERTQELLNAMAEKTAVVIGDLYVDEYVHGAMETISAESASPIVQTKERYLQPAAAGHVAMLLREFGLKTSCISVVGNDLMGRSVIDVLLKKGVDTKAIFSHPQFATRARTRISVSGKAYPRHEVLRLDAPSSRPLSTEMLETLQRAVEEKSLDADVVIVVDRDRQVITKEIIQVLRKIIKNRRILLVGDSESQISLFEGFDAVTPNVTEAQRAIGIGEESSEQIESLGRKLLKQVACKNVFISRGSRGIALFKSGGQISHHPTQPQAIFDVTGAGETVAAAVAGSLAAGASYEEAANFANLAAGVAVTKPGMALVTKSEILLSLRTQQAQSVVNKVVGNLELKAIVENEKTMERRVVWTNGCFDLMHVGHILYLEKAKSLGDVLVVGLNSDASVRKYKGPSRPIVEEQQRARILAALTCVDYVTIFDDETPMKLLEMLQPNVYAKGGDYTIDTINQDERRLVESFGCEIALLPGQEGMSTTQLIERIVSTNHDKSKK